MNWPKSAYRRAYEAAREDNARLLTLVEKMASTLAALKRRDVGLPEREPSPKADTVEWDAELERAALRWGTRYSAQKGLAMAALRKGESRFKVLQDLGVPEEEG